MDLKLFKDYGIDNLISQEELDNIINYMIKTYDESSVFYEQGDAISILSEFINDYNSVFSILNNKENEICERRKLEKEIRRQEREKTCQDATFTNEEFFALLTDEYNDSINVFEDEYEWQKSEGIYGEIIRSLVPIARKRMEDRINHRFKIGTKIEICNFKYEKYGDQFEFYHDGGWGVTDQDGIVTISNHLVTQPSKSRPLFYPLISSYVNNQLYKTQDRDTNLFGVICLNPLIELLPCEFDQIESMVFSQNNYKFALKVQNKDGLWGCYNDYCNLIADCKYDIIDFNGGFIECGRDGEFRYSDNRNDDGYTMVYDGKKDLYDITGKLILGGFTEFKYDKNKDWLLFYFETFKVLNPFYDRWYDITRYEYVTCYQYAKCFILNINYQPALISGYSIPNPFGSVIEKIEDIQPSLLIYGHVEDIDREFIFSKKQCGDYFVFSEYVKSNQQDQRISLKLNNSSKNTVVEIESPKNSELEKWEWVDDYIERDLVFITHFKEDGLIDWRTTVNEYWNNYAALLVRIGSKVGLLMSQGVRMSSFDAISTEFDLIDKRYVAKIVETPEQFTHDEDRNPNYSVHHGCFIQFFKVDKDGWPIRLEDDWDVFNPTLIDWFPHNFLELLEIYPSCDERSVGDIVL
jgi:hypothetical protein